MWEVDIVGGFGDHRGADHRAVGFCKCRELRGPEPDIWYVIETPQNTLVVSFLLVRLFAKFSKIQDALYRHVQMFCEVDPTTSAGITQKLDQASHDSVKMSYT